MDSSSWSLEAGENLCPVQAESVYFPLFNLLCSSQAITGLDETHSHWGRRSALPI